LPVPLTEIGDNKRHGVATNIVQLRIGACHAVSVTDCLTGTNRLHSLIMRVEVRSMLQWIQDRMLQRPVLLKRKVHHLLQHRCIVC